MSSEDPEATYNYALRLPESLRFSLETLARTDRRSLNAEIVYVLELYVRQRMQDDSE